MAWVGTLQPTPESPVYTVRLSFNRAGLPIVKVLSPTLRSDAPHRFTNGALCLHRPQDRHWTSDQFVSTTIVPWTAFWLHFYEIWMDTGKWLGPEAHHDVRKRVR